MNDGREVLRLDPDGFGNADGANAGLLKAAGTRELGGKLNFGASIGAAVGSSGIKVEKLDGALSEPGTARDGLGNIDRGAALLVAAVKLLEGANVLLGGARVVRPEPGDSSASAGDGV